MNAEPTVTVADSRLSISIIMPCYNATPYAEEAVDASTTFLRAFPWPFHAALLRKKLVDQRGGFSVRRFSAMDYAFWLRDLSEGQVLRQANRAFWKRDLVSAQKLFRHSAAQCSFSLRDLRHILAALFPMPLYGGIVNPTERSHP